MIEYTKTPFIAANLLKSWLRAVGVESCFIDRTEPVLAVGDFKFLVSDDIAPLTVSPKDILSRNKERALNAFWKVTDHLGMERKQPFERGIEPVGNNGDMAKASYKDDMFVAAIRSADFRRAPNPDATQWKRYEKIVKNACNKFLFVNKSLCQSHGLELDDILQYGRCYLVNFCAKYEIPMAEANENEKLFNVYMQQRLYGDLKRVLKKATEGDGAENIWVSFDEAIDDSSYLFKEGSYEDRELELEEAREHLGERLNALEHDKLLESITNVVNAGQVGVKVAATKLLRNHLDTCAVCRVEVDEHLPEGDGLSS